MGEVEGEIEGVEDEEEQEGSNKQRGSFVHGFFFFFSLTPTPTLTLTFSLLFFSLYGNHVRVCVVGRRGKEGRRGACFFLRQANGVITRGFGRPSFFFLKGFLASDSLLAFTGRHCCDNKSKSQKFGADQILFFS